MKVLRCKVCLHPKREAINEALLAGTKQVEILRTIAPDLTRHSISFHSIKEHHLRDISRFRKPGEPSRPDEPSEPAKPATKRTTRTKQTTPQDRVKVHWEIPRSLLKDLKHKAVDKEVPTVELARQYLRHGVDHL